MATIRSALFMGVLEVGRRFWAALGHLTTRKALDRVPLHCI
jgi:hypothetical protein